MAQTIYAQDNEFAASTGSNVNSGPGTSTFDYPPTSTRNLTITSNAGDTDPFRFDVGETYDIAFQGNGGTTLEDAVVIRSDFVGASGGAVVFEGTDPDGNLVQLVWSPGFDLETWYFSNFDQGQSPGFYTTDQQAATYEHVCFAAGTRIDTPGGPVPVQHLRPGQQVTTVDHGPQPVRWAGLRRVTGPGAAAVVIAPGTLDATAPLAVSRQHRILIRSPLAELLFAAPEVWVPAHTLVNGHSVRIAPRPVTDFVHVLFDRHEVLTANGVAAESLFTGDIATARLEGELREADLPARRTPMRLCRPALRPFEARYLARRIGLAGAPQRAHPALLHAA